jgi:hypothetical protein
MRKLWSRKQLVLPCVYGAGCPSRKEAVKGPVAQYIIIVFRSSGFLDDLWKSATAADSVDVAAFMMTCSHYCAAPSRSIAPDPTSTTTSCASAHHKAHAKLILFAFVSKSS